MGGKQHKNIAPGTEDDPQVIYNNGDEDEDKDEEEEKEEEIESQEKVDQKWNSDGKDKDDDFETMGPKQFATECVPNKARKGNSSKWRNFKPSSIFQSCHKKNQPPRINKSE